MSTVNQSEHLQLAFDLINKARVYANAGKYIDAQKTLDSAEKYAINNPDLMNNIREHKQAILETRYQFVKKIEEQLIEVFDQERFDSSKARNLLHILQQEDANNELAKALLSELPNKEEAERVRALVERFRIDIEKIWKIAKDYEKGGAGAYALEEYERALKEASIQAGNFQNSPLFMGILAEAQRKRNKAKEIWEGTPTIILSKQGKELIERYEKLKQEKVSEAEYFNEHGDWEGKYPIDQCIKLATEMASKFADRKADEYLENARRILEESPVAAELKVKEALNLAYLSSFQKAALEAELHEIIIPAVQRRENANLKIKEALSQTDAEVAWLLLVDAEEIDQFAPGLPDARNKFVPMLISQFEDLQSSAEREAELENFSIAEKSFQDLLEMAKRFSTYGEEFQNLFDIARKSYEDFVSFKNKIDALDKQLASIILILNTDPELANEQLSRIETQGLSELEKSKLDRCRVRVDFRLGVEQLYNNLEQKMLQSNEEVDLLPVEGMIEEAINSYPTEEKFKNLAERIGLRSKFLKGVRLKNDPKKRTEARDLFDDVFTKRGDDALNAQAFIDEITSSEEQEADIAIAIKQAKDAIESREPRIAYLYLEPFRYSVSRQSAQIKKLIGIALADWQHSLDRKLEEIVHQSEISLPEVEAIIAELTRSQSPRLDEWRERALAPAFANAARDWETVGKFDTALKLWENAFKLAPNNPIIVEGRKKSQKQRGLIKAQLAMDLSEKEQLLNDLNNIYPDDVQVKRSLAEFYYRQSRYGEARMIVRQADFLIKTQGESDNSDDNIAIQEIGNMLAEADIIDTKKLSIQAKTSGHVSVESFWDAKSIFDGLIYDFPHRADELNAWWADLVQHIEERINGIVSELSNQSDSIWRRIELLFKLLILKPDDSIRQELGTLMILAYKQFPELVSSVVDNPTGKNFGSRADALHNHIEKASTVYLDLKNISQFEKIAHEVGVNLPENKIDITKNQLELREVLDNLHAVLNKKSEIKSQIQAALATGEWEPVDDSIEEIKKLKLYEHRGIQDIKDEIKKAKDQRQDANLLVKKLEDDFTAENFADVLDGIEKLRNNDPAGTMMVLDSLKIRDPFTLVAIIGVHDLERVTEEKVSLLKKIKEWYQNQKPIVDIDRIHQTIQENKNLGNFDKAINICKWIIDASDKQEDVSLEFGEGVSSWANRLNILRKWMLEEKVVANSNITAKKLEEINSEISHIEATIGDLAQMQVHLEQDQARMKKIILDLKPLIERLRAKNLFDDFLYGKDLLEMKQKAIKLIKEGQGISPNYKMFTDLLGDSILRN